MLISQILLLITIVIILYTFLCVLQEKGYRINLKTKSCQTFRLNDPFRPFAIPNNATSDGYIFVPSSVSGAGVEAVIWSGNTTDPVGMSHYVEYCLMEIGVHRLTTN